MRKKTVAMMLAIMMVALALCACANNSEPIIPVDVSEEPAPLVVDVPAPTPEDLPEPKFSELWRKIDGSTSTIPLTAAIHDFWGGGAFPPTHSTTPYAYERLIEGQVDLVFVTYPSANEFMMAENAGVEMEIIPVTKDALVFLVNIANPLDDIPLTRLQDIYMGKTDKWQDLGGTDEDIIAYQRPVDSGSQTLFLKLLMDGREPMQPPAEWRLESMGILVEHVSSYDNSPNAIGYSVFYYVNNMYGNDRFKLLAINGVKPTRNTIANGEYALEDYYYAVMRKDTPADSPARELVAWLLTEEGQVVAAEAGYIPLSPLDNIEADEAIDPVYLGDVDNSSGTGGTEPKSENERAYVLGRDVRRPLSDLFYDGFNYIKYINTEIIRQLQQVESESFWRRIPKEELTATRPFPGIPNDYPHYELGEYGYLYINIPENNPFFNGSMSFSIPLTEDISPYGTGGADEYTVTYAYGRQLLPHADLYTLSIDIAEAPAVAARINKSLQAWTDGFKQGTEQTALLESFVSWYIDLAEFPDFVYKFQPSVSRWQDYLSVSYVLQTHDGPAMYMPMLYTICLDINTGKTVNLLDKLPVDLDYAKASIFTPASFAADIQQRSDYMPEGYTPAAGFVVTDAWIMDERFSVYITEPDGRRLQVFFWRELDS